jgi:hypothetical protein
MLAPHPDVLKSRLIEANRALIGLGAIDRKQRDPSFSKTVHDALRVYFELLSCNQLLTFSETESLQLQFVIDRLRATLLFFGEDV